MSCSSNIAHIAIISRAILKFDRMTRFYHFYGQKSNRSYVRATDVLSAGLQNLTPRDYSMVRLQDMRRHSDGDVRCGWELALRPDQEGPCSDCTYSEHTLPADPSIFILPCRGISMERSATKTTALSCGRDFSKQQPQHRAIADITDG
jgi:hypothetical protein